MIWVSSFDVDQTEPIDAVKLLASIIFITEFRGKIYDLLNALFFYFCKSSFKLYKSPHVVGGFMKFKATFGILGILVKNEKSGKWFGVMVDLSLIKLSFSILYVKTILYVYYIFHFLV